MSKPWIDHPTVLHGQLVDLLPLEEKHFEDLLTAASDKRIWEFYPGDWSVREKFMKVYSDALVQREKGERYPFIIFHKPSGRIIGSTMFLISSPMINDLRSEARG